MIDKFMGEHMYMDDSIHYFLMWLHSRVRDPNPTKIQNLFAENLVPFFTKLRK
jgi:hypothetical protein